MLRGETAHLRWAQANLDPLCPSKQIPLLVHKLQLLCGLAFGSALLSGAGPLLAQTREVRNLAADTLQPTNPKYYLPVSRIGMANGQLPCVFIPDGEVRGPNLAFTWRNPMTLPRPKPLTIKMAEVKWVLTGNVYYEPVHLLGQLYSGLAPRMLAWPRVESFDVATPKKGVPIPLPVPGGGLIWAGAFSTNYNHTWFLRRPGLTRLVQVLDGKQFAPFLADYFAGAPALAAAIRAGAEDHRHADVARLLDAYN